MRKKSLEFFLSEKEKLEVFVLFLNTASDDADAGRGRSTPLHQQQEKHDLRLLIDARLERQAVQWRWTRACVGAAFRRHVNDDAKYGGAEPWYVSIAM